MIVRNGKCMAENPVPVVKIVAAKSLGGYLLDVLFNDNSHRVFDGSVLLDGEVFKPLSDQRVFADYKLDYETLTWNDGDIDVAPEYVYTHSKGVV